MPSTPLHRPIPRRESPERVAVIIPARDEASVIARTVEALRHQARVVVVDNGSTDDTARRAREAGAEVVHEPSPGYGRAIQAGLAHLTDAPDTVVVIFDADLADDPRLLMEVVRPITQDEADLVLSARTTFAEPGALTTTQYYGNWLALTLIYWSTGQRFQDLGPMRAMRWRTWMQLGLRDPTWGWNVEIQMKAVHQGLRILEVPLPYRRRHSGQSKISGTLIGSVRAGYRIVTTILRHHGA